MKQRGLVLDCDGVLADTERDGHLPAFNEVFERHGVPLRWSVEEYTRLVRIGGGRERIAHAIDALPPGAVRLPSAPEARAAMVKRWHREKTDLFARRVAAGAIPPRPGVARLIGEALAADWSVAIASTAAEPSVRAVLLSVVGAEQAARVAVFAGDVVPEKKPAPDIYVLALHELGLDADEVVVIEDSASGLRAARAAGLVTVVTTSSLTRDDDFTGAALVLDCLGDPDGPVAHVLAGPDGLRNGRYVILSDLERVLR